MVWFQCEDCGENLKKPKLQNHFRMCSANKLSCIDCGVTFNRESVQGHTQCVSEAAAIEWLIPRAFMISAAFLIFLILLVADEFA